MINRRGHVFISYARSDGTHIAENLYEALCTRNIPAWRDERNLNPFQDFSGEIEIAIEHSSHVVVCLTPSIVTRKDSFVRREIIYAQGCRIPIIPVIFPGFPIDRVPVLITHLTWLSFTDVEVPDNLDFEGGLERLLKRLTQPARTEFTPPQQDPFWDYLQALYCQIVSYLDTTVFSLVSLGTESSVGAVEKPDKLESYPLPMNFFAASLPVRDTETMIPRRFKHIAEAFENAHRQLLLLGEPGAGKTTTLMAFAREAIARRLEDTRAPLPLVGRISDWARMNELNLSEWLSRSLHLDNELTTVAFDQGKVLLLLDGLDELGISSLRKGKQKDNTRKNSRVLFIEALEASLGDNQAIVTCRVSDYHSIGRKIALRGAVTLEPLQDGLLKQYLSKQPNLWLAIQTDDRLYDMVRTPLLLSLLTFAYRGIGDRVREMHNLSKSPGELREMIFRAYVERRFQHEQLRVNANLPFSVKDVYSVLGQAALDNIDFEFGPNSRTGMTLEESIAISAGEKASQFIDQALRLHLLIKDAQDALRFMHRLVRDHFGFPLALEELHSKTSTGVHQSCALLADIGDPRAVEPMLRLIKPDGRLPLALLVSLWQIPDLRIVIPFARSLSSVGQYSEDDPFSIVAHNGLTFLRRTLGREKITETLVHTMSDTPAGHRADYAIAIGLLGGSTGLPALITLLTDVDPEVRGCAAYGLAEMGDISALEPLTQLLNDRTFMERSSNAIGPTFYTPSRFRSSKNVQILVCEIVAQSIWRIKNKRKTKIRQVLRKGA